MGRHLSGLRGVGTNNLVPNGAELRNLLYSVNGKWSRSESNVGRRRKNRRSVCKHLKIDLNMKHFFKNYCVLLDPKALGGGVAVSTGVAVISVAISC